jgi:predicted amidohydrolase
MRLLLTAVNCPKGDLKHNLHRSIELLRVGKESGCDLVLLPEMSLTGYEATAAISLRHPTVTELVRATGETPALCFGLVESSGTDQLPYITQALASGGRLIAVHRKATLGDGEHSVFQAGTPSGRSTIGSVSVSVAVCAEIGSPAAYRQGSTVVLAPSAPGLYGERRSSDADWQQGFDWWRGSARQDAEILLQPKQWLAVSTQAGPTYDEDFPGWAALVGYGGLVVEELRDWKEGTLVVDVPA